jgi:chitin synthase
MLSHFAQKGLIFSLWFCVNLTLIVTSILYSKYWYIFIVPLSLSTSFNCLSVILIVLVRIKNLFFKPKQGNKTEYSKRSLGFLVPCYNETEEELKYTFDSLTSQNDIEENKKMLFVVCDGRVKGKDANLTTDNI